MGRLVTAVMTFIAPLEDCGPDHGDELFKDIQKRFDGWNISMEERNSGGDGMQMMRYDFALTKWVAGDLQ
ncbi:hypothetical protein [Mesorhizobium sp.]|uniref:hypothetical protein n=1 Tax=Mesorhizobium sp. TaxID=1871066 RepID=UPI000FE3C0A4|nr:hypothetical protein [Mesorhizobium sp.]RWK39260.1 MAG: hypothetical protein EOR40_04420 [Mesorhizobium sp.]